MAAHDKRARMEALAALRGGKKRDYTSQDTAIYDTITEEDYRAIVKGRLQEDDFIEDDDGSGYVDQGVDEWEQAQASDRDRDGSDAESKYQNPGPSNKSRGSRKATASKPAPPAKAPRAKPALRKANGATATNALASSSGISDYRKPKPDIDDGDFMESLLGGLDAAPVAFADNRKRKGSPAYPEPTNLRMRGNKHSYASSASPSSDPAFDDFVEQSNRGDSETGSDVEGLDEARGPKKLRLSGVEHPMEHMGMEGGPTFDMALPMDVDEEDDHQVPNPKAVKGEEEEDNFTVKPLSRSAAGPAGNRARPLVNARSVRAHPPAIGKSEAQGDTPSLQADRKPKPKGLDWQAALRDIQTTTDSEPSVGEQSEDDRVHATDFLADLPRKQSAAQAKRAAQAAADAQLPQPVKVEALAADGSVRFFWLDYLEVQGVLHLFGKVADQATGKWRSCCVTVEGIERNLFFLPRDTYTDEDGDIIEPTEDDVYDDIEEVLKSANITEFRCKPVSRKYAFEIQGVPSESTKWNKVVYGFDKPALPMNIQGKTFSRAFGTNTTAFELFVLKRKIMGPCWLDVRGAVPSQRPKPISWCKTELVVKNPKLVNPFPDTDPNAPREAPPLTIASISIRDIMNHNENKREIVCVALRLWNEANLEDTTPIERQPSTVKTFVRPLNGWPQGFEDACRKTTTSKVLLAQQEAALLNNLLGTLSLNDPDVLVGHELSGAALEVLLHRMRDLKTVHWSRIGRFRRDRLPSLKVGGFNSFLTVGRLLCDLASDGSKSMIASTTWSLTEMVSTHLKIVREDIDPDDTFAYFDSTAQRLMTFVMHCEADSFFQMAIANKVQILPLTKQLTNLAGNSWNQTLLGGRAQRNEYILLHEFHRQKYICPDKMSFAERRNAKALADAENGDPAEGGNKGGKKEKYKGGLVFEPKRGLWDRFILVMDFNSLYPSIIQEYNIDFTTVDRSGDHSNDINWLPEVPASDVKQGVLPRLIATLVKRRRQVKSLMKDRDTTPAKMLQYDIKQMALKLTANSMYGCLGFDGSRFYAPPLAALTTSKGREILISTKELAENNQLDVVYGDTDSVMINTNAVDLELAKQTGNEFKKLVNERYRLLDIDTDAIFQRLLLLQKKKYAALKVDDNGERVMEVKGLDMKRREYCQLSKGASQYILNQVLSGDATETVVEKVHEYLTELGQRVTSGDINLDEFIIHMRLGKNPQDYPDAKSLPHVQVALRMKGKGSNVKSGDVIPYVFCLGEDGSSSKTAQANKARHPDDLRRPDTPFRIDYDYYLSAQVLPPVERLCDPIEGTDRARLAGCLGLDPNRFRTVAVTNEAENEFATLSSQVPDAVRFRDAEPFRVSCRHCKTELDFLGVHQDESNIVTSGGVVCCTQGCGRALGAASLAVQLEAQIRRHVYRLYEGWLVCDDASCGSRTRMMSVYGKRCLNAAAACRGSMRYEYTDAALYNQLLYLDSLFDPDKALRNCQGASRIDEVKALLEHNKATLARLRAVVSQYLERNGRRFVNMAGLFSFMRISA